MIDYPYMMSNGKIGPIIIKIQQAAKPQRFTQETLRTLGFTSTNDRAFIPLVKKLGFLTESGVPTSLYDLLKDSTSTAKILASQIKQLYAQLYMINTNIHLQPEEEIKGAISRVTGKDAEGVTRIYNTFKALTTIADFDLLEPTTAEEQPPVETGDPAKQNISSVAMPELALQSDNGLQNRSQFHYNIQIHLPATTDITVYNMIFKSLKENLLM